MVHLIFYTWFNTAWGISNQNMDNWSTCDIQARMTFKHVWHSSYIALLELIIQ